MADKNNARLEDWKDFLEAGIDPKTRRPMRWGGDKVNLKADTKRFLRLIDEQDAVNRFVWDGLPGSITSQELERMIYYKGQLCLFHLPELDTYFFMPYALDGSIDFYGRYVSVHPVPMSSGTTEESKKAVKAQEEYLSKLVLKCIYSENDKVEDPDKSTVLLHDYTKQEAQSITPRVYVNDSLLDAMADCVPFLHTSLLLGTGIKGLRVADADQAESVKAANDSMERAALKGEPYIPIVGSLEFQDLNNPTSMTTEDYMSAYQSFDNIRLSGYGIDNGGAFEKKAHVLQDEQEVNNSPNKLVLNDGLTIRQNFCDLANKVFGLSISVQAAEIQEQEEDEDGFDDDGESATEVRD